VPTRKRFGTQSAASSTERQPEPLVYFLDESLDGPTVATALREAGATVVRATECFPRGTADEVWLAEAGRNRWIVLTRDKRIRYRQLELLALHEARVRTFVFTGGNVTLKDTATILVGALKHMVRIARADPGPFIYHLGRAGRPVRMR
jgi:predicted nuclease of predicted toxin-antitoxin system